MNTLQKYYAAKTNLHSLDRTRDPSLIEHEIDSHNIYNQHYALVITFAIGNGILLYVLANKIASLSKK